MVKVEGTTITLTRGDTLEIEVKINDATGMPYSPKTGEVVRFSVKKKIADRAPVIEKVLDNETLILRLESEETKVFENPRARGEAIPYVYDVEITLQDGTVSTIINAALINIVPEVY